MSWDVRSVSYINRVVGISGKSVQLFLHDCIMFTFLVGSCCLLGYLLLPFKLGAKRLMITMLLLQDCYKLSFSFIYNRQKGHLDVITGHKYSVYCSASDLYCMILTHSLY